MQGQVPTAFAADGDLRPLLNALAQQIAVTELQGNSFELSVSVADMTSGPEISLE